MAPPPDETPKSLGDGVTGSDVEPPEDSSAQSLGDQSTTGDVGSSVSDRLDLGEDFGEGTEEVVDLEARYEIESTLGQGGMGEVVLAQDKRLNRQVAIKRLKEELGASRKAAQRFLTEAQSVAALNHFNIVQIYDYGLAADGPFIVMELVSGGSLAEKLEAGALELDEAIELTCQLCEALGAAHQAGIVHRDIKPANVLMTTEGVPKLTDFGLARQETVDGGQTQAGAMLGTLDFMPPEQKVDATQADARSDLWSLAATLYQMVTGRSPRIIKFNNVPQSLQDVLGKALEDEQADRYQDATEFRDALRTCLARAAVPVAEVPVELDVGECPQCQTKNELNRKFCRNPSCAASLRMNCLKCESDIPTWYVVCGECGTNQETLLSAQRAELDGKREQAESLLAAYSFDESLAIAREITAVEDVRLQHLKEWSETFIDETRTEKDRQEQDNVTHLAESRTHREAFDYASAIQAMETIPEAMLTDDMSSWLKQLHSDHEESQALVATITERVQRRDLEGLLEQVERAAVLRGDRDDLRTLQQQLRDRSEKSIGRRDAAYSEARSLLSQGQAQEALARIRAVKTQELRAPDNELRSQLEEIVSAEHELTVMVKESKAEKVPVPDKVMAIWQAAARYLAINPRHEKIAALQKQLGDRIRKDPEKYSHIPGYALLHEVLTLDHVDVTRVGEKTTNPFTGQAVVRSADFRQPVSSVAFSPDGHRIVSGGQGDGIMVWDADTGQKTLTFGEEATTVSFSPDGKRIVSGSTDGTLMIWDAQTGQESLTLEGHSSYVLSVSFSPDGKRIVSGSDDKTLKVWDAQTGQKTHTLEGHSEVVNSVSFSPDGKRIVSGSDDKTLKVWDALTGQETLTLKGHSDDVDSVSFSPDGKRIVSGSHDKTLKVWDALTGQETLTFKGHTDFVSSVSFSPDGKRIASSSANWETNSGLIRVWDAETGQMVLALGGLSSPDRHSGAVASVSFSPDGMRIISGSDDGTVKVWNLSMIETSGDIPKSSHGPRQPQADDLAPEKNKTAVNPVTPRLSNGRPGDIVKAHMRDCSENTLHVAPDIPAKKLANAMAKYMPNVRETDVLLLYDNTVWGGAKDGMSLTSDTLYWHAPFVSSGSISYDDIVGVSIGEKSLVVRSDESEYQISVILGEADEVMRIVQSLLRKLCRIPVIRPEAASESDVRTATLRFETELAEIAKQLIVANNEDFILQIHNVQIVHPGAWTGAKLPFGFMVHCTFDNQPDKHDMFRQSRVFSSFTREDDQSIPCYQASLGNDPKRTAAILVQVLVDVYQVTDLQSVAIEKIQFPGQ